jgi:hypothetical protein
VFFSFRLLGRRRRPLARSLESSRRRLTGRPISSLNQKELSPPRHLALGVAAGVGVGIGAGALLAQQQRRQQRRDDDPSASAAAALALAHPAAKFGLPQSQTLRVHRGFLTMFDSATRNPAWVVEHVCQEQMYYSADR